ncbi:uncharacterized protein F5Z01DRAFT_330012 [Emericellopsis atlantica]|uniref:SWI/SNF chromatin-remodeling complex subunit sol1 n=1 Tax=Emericellopsis atlantica TaxID=2614577 RepID=A0A9P7ZG99_9HYPO|nr:uncharacterized protein F5Z01DRAFT_330012 [Emericellopsis atlantica]KAG9251030.1 hypothetical protein F5Z01DRAFT_330012 [Emericellopsis atlantica]
MSNWMNDANPNHNGNGFPHMNDPNVASAMMDPSAFMANPGQFNPAQLQNMQNGAMRNPSPATMQQNPSAYQGNSVIPSKRPRPSDDGASGSPTQNPGMLPNSRSQTPQQQNFPPGFQQTAGQFPHLQANGSANASPSPIMNNQMRPGSVPQRVATASPHPFSPSTQQFAPHASPVPSEQGTPQPNQFMQQQMQQQPQQQQNMPPGYNPAFSQSPSNARPSPNPNAMMPQHMAQMQHMQQMGHMYPQMQQQQHQQQQQQQQAQQQMGMAQQQQRSQMPQTPTEQQKLAAYQARLQQQLQGNMQMGRGMMNKPPQQMSGTPNGQAPQAQAMRQRPGMTAANPEQFMKNLTSLMSAKGLPLDTNPMIADPPQMPNAALALKHIYERNLYTFEEVWMAQHKQRMMQHKQQQQQQQMLQAQGQQAQNQMQMQQQQQAQRQQQQQQPSQHMHPGQQQPQQTQQPNLQQQTPVKPPVNGLSTPQQQHMAQPPSAQGHQRNSMSRGVETPVQSDFVMPSPAHSKAGSIPMQQQQPLQSQPQQHIAHDRGEPPAPSEVLRKSDEYTPCSRELTSHGGIDLDSVYRLGHELLRFDPAVPQIAELGNIDIHALTKGLQSGIHGEIKVALDTLVTVSNSPHQPHHFIRLPWCDDLIDSLIDAAEEPISVLVDHTAEVCDELQIAHYDEVVRACRIEQWTIQERPAYRSSAYQIDRAVDRLICITTILRNLSFPGPGDQNENQPILAEDTVVKFLCVIIRYLGTRTMFLRTHANTLDLMKDLVVLLSNIAGSMEIPGRDEALCLLHFLVAFAPGPGPTKSDNNTWIFPPFEPSLHPYLPHAVDALAKLFARDEPNRTHFRTVFLLDGGSDPTYELLTRTFALAISPVPDKVIERHRAANQPPLFETRKPSIMQGLLCAEILVSLAPGPESGLTKSWLRGDINIAQNLLEMVSRLSRIYEAQTMHKGGRGPPRRDLELVFIASTAIAVVRRLFEKAKDLSDSDKEVLAYLPSSDKLLEITSLTSADWAKEGLMQQYTACHSLGR